MDDRWTQLLGGAKKKEKKNHIYIYILNTHNSCVGVSVLGVCRAGTGFRGCRKWEKKWKGRKVERGASQRSSRQREGGKKRRNIGKWRWKKEKP